MSNGEGKEGTFDGKTYLYIRTNPADDGSEPLPGGLPFWTSPDITIIHPGGIRDGEAVANQPNQVEVVVTNAGGIDAVDAFLEVFMADPSTAFTPATAMLVGKGFASIPGYSAAITTFPWTPAATDEGHRCILARVCLAMPPDCYSNGSIFDVVGDRHVAQRNIHVLNITEKSASFGFKMVNPMRGAAEFSLRFKEIKVTAAKAKTMRRALGCDFSQFTDQPLKETRLHVGEAYALDEQGAAIHNAEMPVGVLSRRADGGKPRAISLRMGKGEIRHAVVTVTRNPKARAGELNVLQIEQVNSRAKKTVGGLWLIIRN